MASSVVNVGKHKTLYFSSKLRSLIYYCEACVKRRMLCTSSSVRSASSFSSSSPLPSQQADPAVVTSTAVTGASEKSQKISKAMKAYLERANAFNKFMAEEITEYEIGKRHVANIMGLDPETISQEDIDKAISYLLPSGIFEPKARPMLKHPRDVIPQRKGAQFGMDGRPFHSFFYTGKPNYVQLLHDTSLKIEELKKYEDSRLDKGVMPEESDTIQMAGSEWLEKKFIEQMLTEPLSDEDYKSLLAMLTFLASMSFSSRVKDFVFQYRKVLQPRSLYSLAPQLVQDESGRTYCEADGKRRTASATVKLWTDGTGKVIINNMPLIDYYPRLMDREQVLFPLHFVDKLCDVDFEATVVDGGIVGQAGAVRLALSKALLAVVDADTAEKMRLAGLLTQDPRVLERQKPGQKGARRKYTWKKR